MAARGRAVGWIILAVWLCLGAATRAQATVVPSAEATATILGGTVATPGMPLPISIDLLTPPRGFAGDIVISWVGDPERTRWVIPVDVGEGAFHYRAYPVVPGQEAKLSVVLREPGVDDIMATVQPVKYRGFVPEMVAQQVLVVSSDRRVMSKLGRSLTATRATTRDYGTIQQPWIDARMVSTNDAIPERWYGYLSYQAVLYNCDTAVALTDDQVAALRRWVAAGGRLILYNAHPERYAWITKTLGFTAPPAGVGREYLQPHGVGAIIWLAATNEELGEFSEDRWERLLAIDPQADAVQTVAATDGYIEDSIASAALSMQSRVGAQIVNTGLPLWRLWGLGFGYLLVVSLGEYLLLRRLKKLTYTWVTLPIMVLVACVVSYQMFLVRGSGDSATSAFVIRDADTLGECHGITRYVAFRNGRNADLDLGVPDDTLSVGWPRLVLRMDGGYYGSRTPVNSDDAMVTLRSGSGGQRMMASSAISQIHLFRQIAPGDGEYMPVDVDVSVDATGGVVDVQLSEPWSSAVFVVGSDNRIWLLDSAGAPQLIDADRAAEVIANWLPRRSYSYWEAPPAASRYSAVDWLLARGVGGWPGGPAVQALNARRVVHDGQVLVVLMPSGVTTEGTDTRQTVWRQVVVPHQEDAR